ncbi:hypothetical protein PaG_05057 [Moesziomyces aphidis]|uniref:Uncharacterized protein n=1 Tax=Moesziomyces aphidis TaxID=84754 RepID=W3VHR0_MOEAP|nr:hypothetical protein PaG_05057 [Moesziomyces aphidis]
MFLDTAHRPAIHLAVLASPRSSHTQWGKRFIHLAIFGTHPLASSAIRAPDRKRRGLTMLEASHSRAALICARGWLG